MKREDITPQQKITELRLDISHPNSKQKVFILLEGESDVKLYRSLFNNDTCKIETIPGGKIFLEIGLRTLINLHRLILGIRDADFIHLEGKKVELSNLFLTDYHDSEMMMASENQCISNIFFEHTKLKSQEHNNVFQKILQAIRFLGYFRWFNDLENESNGFQFNFNSLGLGDLFDKEHFKIDEKALIQKVIERSPNAKIKDVDVILGSIKQLFNDNHDLLQLCNGHDFMKIMSLLCSSRNKGYSDKDMASIFRITYNQEMFKKTQLFKDISEWATQNNCTLFHP